MSLHLNFEPHSWYKEFAIKDYGKLTGDNSGNDRGYRWQAYTLNGNTGYIYELEADTLRDLKNQITLYHARIAERDNYNRKLIGEK